MSWNTPDFVQVTHLPTGITTKAETHQRGATFRARELAFEMLRGKLYSGQLGTPMDQGEPVNTSSELAPRRSYDLTTGSIADPFSNDRHSASDVLDGEIPIKYFGRDHG